MRNILVTIFAMAFSYLFWYGLFSLFNWQINMGEWKPWVRIVWMFFGWVSTERLRKDMLEQLEKERPQK